MSLIRQQGKKKGRILPKVEVPIAVFWLFDVGV